MKKLYPSGRAMPTRTSPSEPKQSSHATSSERMPTSVRSLLRVRSISPFYSYRRRGMVSSMSATSNLYDVLKRGDWLAIFSPWHLINKAKRYTTLLLPTIFVSVFICFSGAAKAQSRQDVGTAEVVTDFNTTVHKVIPVDDSEIIARVEADTNYNLKMYPMNRYEVDKSRIISIEIGDTIPDEILDMPLWVVGKDKPSDTLRLRNFPSESLIVLDFWAGWCGPCVASMNHWEEYMQNLPEDVVFLGVHMDYAFKAYPFIQKRNWNSKSIIGLGAYILNNCFFDQEMVSRLAWIKNHKLISLTSLQEYDLQFVQEILGGKNASIAINGVLQRKKGKDIL